MLFFVFLLKQAKSLATSLVTPRNNTKKTADTVNARETK